MGIYVLAEVALGKSGPSDESETTEKSQLAKGFNSSVLVNEKKRKFMTKVFGDVSVPFESNYNQQYTVYNAN